MQTLKKFEFKESQGIAKAKYDWTTLLDGKIRKLEMGEDFTTKPVTFSMLCKNAAKKRKKIARTNTLREKQDDGTTRVFVVIQAQDDPNAAADETPAGDGGEE